MARHKKSLLGKLSMQIETVIKFAKRHPWARNVWTAVLFLGAVYFVYKFIAPMIFN